MNKPTNILIVEDEVELAEILRDYLIAENFAVDVTNTGAGVVDRARDNPPDLMLLDLMLPEVDGISICGAVRKFSDLPIIMVTAKVSEVDRVLGLNIGADDYICKPAKPKEVVARVKAVLRRSQLSQGTAGLSCLQLDEDLKHANLVGEYFELSPVEFRLLEMLNKNSRHVCPRESLKSSIYTDDREVDDHMVDLHIQSLSRKLTLASNIQSPIRSVYAIGFVLELDSKPSTAFPASVEAGGTG